MLTLARGNNRVSCGRDGADMHMSTRVSLKAEVKQKAAELRAAGGDMTEDAESFFAHVYHFL